MMKHRLSRCIIFIIIVSVVLILLENFLQPIWRAWNNYDTVQGFYDQPDNTIETVFLGSSVVINGITPMELYRDYGICAYNLATEQQPMLASYYWLKEAYRLHSETLDTVVLDVSTLRYTPDIAYYQKAIDGMKISLNKWEAVGAYTSSLQEQLSYFFPLFEYHSRWTDLDKNDFKKTRSSFDTFLRGYNYDATEYIKCKDDADGLTVPEYTVNLETEQAELNTESLLYLQKTVDFCEEHGIRLVLIKTPGYAAWNSEYHNAVSDVATEYGLEFLDFIFDPLFSEIGFNNATNTTDGVHPNYCGAVKLTEYLGRYLIESCRNHDVRGNEKYAFMGKNLDEYDAYIKDKLMDQQLDQLDSVEKYLQTVLTNPDNIVFITAKDDASNSLTEAQREVFRELGLTELAELGYRDSYIGIINQSGVIQEFHQSDPGENAFDVAEEGETLYLSAEGYINPGISYEVKSGGYSAGNLSSCIINLKEYSLDKRGLNIVVYNRSTEECTNSRNFDTWMYSEQTEDVAEAYELAVASGIPYNQMTGKVAELYLYNAECSAKKEAVDLRNSRTDDGFLYYLSHYMNRDNTVIYISAMDDAAGQMTQESRQFLKDEGLPELADLQYRDSYIGIIRNGSVLTEKAGHGETPIEEQGTNYEISSGGFESGNCSSVVINNTEYSEACRGLNIVIYDTELNEVIDTETFDTCAFPMTLPQDIVRSEVTE